MVKFLRTAVKGSNILNTSFTWIVSYNCNFRCPYCFEDRVLKNGSKKLFFTKERVDMAYSAMQKIQPNRELRRNSITLYGGEPLLAENKEIVNYIVKEGSKHGYVFNAITNGYEIDHFLNLLSEDFINRLQITVDGPKDLHNKRRIHYKDGETFDKILNNILLALKKDVKVRVRMNTDGRNIDKFLELKDLFKSYGLLSNPNFEIYSARLRDYSHLTEKEHCGLTFISPGSFTEKQLEANVGFLNKEVGMYRGIYHALIEKKPIPFRSIACTAQSGEYVFDPLGNIYPCWEVVGNKKFVKATYDQEGITWNNKVLDDWNNSNISQKEPCRHCKYALICGGGCHYHNMLNGVKEQCDIFIGSFNQIINKAYADLNNY